MVVDLEILWSCLVKSFLGKKELILGKELILLSNKLLRVFGESIFRRAYLYKTTLFEPAQNRSVSNSAGPILS